MLKTLFLLLLATFPLLAAQDSKIEVYAQSIESQGQRVKANGEVVVVYQNSFLYAKRAEYNRQSGDLELFENVRANYEGNYKFLGKYAKLNIAKKERMFEPFYMLEKNSRVWLSGEKGCTSAQNVDISSGVVSGCDPKDPLWKMEFSSSEYNTDTKWLNLYNARLYLYDIPILYTPYFGYSLDTKRRTGLLVPTMGLSDKEGFYYEQALYIAEDTWWDLEFKPQVRTSRGEGIYSQLRFVDSEVSQGSFRAGYFRENNDYALENKLLYDEHYGFNFGYNNRDLLNEWFDGDYLGQSGLYLDINNMTDVDYLNLESNNALNNTTATQLLSRMNLFYNQESDYIAVYARYYKDLTLESNKNTLQKLPTVHYHSYMDTLFDQHLLYNVDIQSDNIYRQVNKKAVQTDMRIPVTLQTSVFDEYLNLSYTSEVFAQHSYFSGQEQIPSGEYDDGVLLKNSNELRASTLLTKAFKENTHVIDLGLSYTNSGLEYRDGFYQDYETLCDDNSWSENEAFCNNEFYNISDTRESLQLDFTQFLYNSQGEQTLYHRLAQNISYENSNSLGELENELEYQFNRYVTLYNNMYYNYDVKKITKALNQLSLNYQGLGFDISHLYRDIVDENKENTSYFTSTLRYTYNEHYSYKASIYYDLIARAKKSSEIGFMYRKRCWDFGLSFVENRRPLLTSEIETSSSKDRFLMISIVLKPFMSVGGSSSDFALRLPENLQGE